MNISYTILSYDGDTAGATIRFTTPNNQEGFTLVMPLPIENGLVVTDPEKLHEWLERAAPRPLFERVEAQAEFKVRAQRDKNRLDADLLGKTGSVPLALPQRPDAAPSMRVGKIKEV